MLPPRSLPLTFLLLRYAAPFADRQRWRLQYALVQRLQAIEIVEVFALARFPCEVHIVHLGWYHQVIVDCCIAHLVRHAVIVDRIDALRIGLGEVKGCGRKERKGEMMIRYRVDEEKNHWELDNLYN